MIATRGFLTAAECTKSVFGPRWGSSRRSPRPTSRLGRGTPLPIPHPLDAFGVSVSSPAATPRRLRRLVRIVPKTPSEIFFLDTALLESFPVYTPMAMKYVRLYPNS